MQLLVVVLHREELLDDVLSALVELELPDAIVVETRTSLELLERDLPIFAGIRSLIPGGIDFSRLVLCLVEHDVLAGQALAAIRELGGGETPTDDARNTACLVPVTDMEYF